MMYQETLAQQVRKREDERLVALVATLARCPFPVRTFATMWHTLEVRAPGVLLGQVTDADQRTVVTSQDVAVMLGQRARQGWRSLERAPLPAGVELGEN